MEIKKLINWCNRERQSIEKMIEFWDSEENYDMVHYEYARLDEIDRVIEAFERCQKGGEVK